MNIFKNIEVKKPNRNTFDLTHDVKMSCKAGNLIPILCMEVLPTDTITLGADTMVRFAPMQAPVMHRFDSTIHYFFVPNRLVWDNWEDFIINEPTGGLPNIQINPSTANPTTEKFLDYFGIPPWSGQTNGTPVRVSALPFAGYQLIYNEYYRDQNLAPEIPYKLNDGGNPLTDLCVIRNRAWEHDYFTACLPWAQKGADVDIPLGRVELDPDWFINNNIPTFQDTTGSPSIVGPLTQISLPGIGINNGANPQAYDPQNSLQVEATTIRDLRRAYKLQEWLEALARGGSRYIEVLKSMFGAISSDARLQRPEYITGVKSPVIISEVLNTTGIVQGVAPDETGGVQGAMSGHGVSIGKGYAGRYYAEEHGYIIGIMSLTAKPAYQNGIPRHFLRTDPLEWYWSQFAHIGEQEVKVNEIFAYTPLGEQTFGYIPRYAEYKYMQSRVAGDFRNSLAFWHAGRIFTTPPTLSQAFIEMTEGDISRIFAVEDGEDYLYCHILNKIKAVRPMPVFGTPMI